MTMTENQIDIAALEDELLAGAELDEAAGDEELSEGADEMFEHFAITVDKGQKLLRLDKYLVDRMEHCSRKIGRAHV